MKARVLFIAASVAVLAGCPDDDDDYYRYDVSVTNLTPNQPMSPLAVLTHNTNFDLFEVKLILWMSICFRILRLLTSI